MDESTTTPFMVISATCVIVSFAPVLRHMLGYYPTMINNCTITITPYVSK